MKAVRPIASVMLASSLLCLSAPGANALTLVRNGASDYVIALGSDASPSEEHAAAELQEFVRQISGVELPIVRDEEPLAEHEIILGNCSHLRQLNVEIDWESLGDEGFAIRTVGDRLVIAGGRLRGTMYGVYTFLEEHLGCRWFSSKVSRIPQKATIELPEIDDTQIPILEYREPFYFDAFDADWAARNRANSRAARLDEQRGGKITYYPFVHSFNQLVPPEEHFDEHPEYFAEVNGRRIRERPQLCLTNPEVVQVAVARVRQWIDEHPGVDIVSVSQNDWGNYCQCGKCRAVAETEGSQAGPLVAFVNEIADAIKDDYPDVAIDTLAYQWSRHPPRSIRPLPNVIIRLCSIECCFSHPLATCDYPQNVSFRDDIVGWSKLCDRVYVWDYVTSFAHYLNPFPNWDVLQPNIRFFVDHGVKGIFEEGNYNSPGGEFAELRAYIMAKCLWDPGYDANVAMDEFLEGYYGAAAPPIREYIDLLRSKVRDDHIHLQIWEGPGAAFLTEDVLSRADELLDEAERLAGEDEALRHRVEVARLPLLYVAMNRWQPPPKREWSLRDGRWASPADPVFTAQVERFFGIAEREGINTHREGAGRLPDFREAVLTKRDGEPVVAVSGARVEAHIAPSLGARLVSLRDTAADVEFAAAGAGYAVSLSRSARGPAASAGFEPIEEEGVGFKTSLDNGLNVYRRFSVEAQKGETLRIWTLVRNTADGPVRTVVHRTLSLDFGPADATVMETPAGPTPLAMPADRTTAVTRVPQQVMASDAITLLNGATKRGVVVAFEGGSPAGAWATVTVSAGEVPVRLDLYQDVGELEPDAGSSVTDTLTLIADADVEGAEQPREHRADVIEIEDDQFGLHREGTLSEYVRDETAADGWAARQLGSDKEWSIQHRLDPGLFEPGAAYRLYAVVKIDKRGDAGKAFDYGVYDTIRKQGVLYGNRSAADMPDDEWQTVELGSVTPQQGQYVWTAPPQNGENVEWVYVDRFYLVKE